MKLRTSPSPRFLIAVALGLLLYLALELTVLGTVRSTAVCPSCLQEAEIQVRRIGEWTVYERVVPSRDRAPEERYRALTGRACTHRFLRRSSFRQSGWLLHRSHGHGYAVQILDYRPRLQCLEALFSLDRSIVQGEAVAAILHRIDELYPLDADPEHLGLVRRLLRDSESREEILEGIERYGRREPGVARLARNALELEELTGRLHRVTRLEELAALAEHEPTGPTEDDEELRRLEP